MIYNKDRLDSAYAKVGLFADAAWQSNSCDDYVRANQDLWVRECALKNPSERIGVPRSILDTIPASHLAEYGTYLYDDAREASYEPTNNYVSPRPSTESILPLNLGNALSCFQPRNDEVWLAPDVEKMFYILTDTNAKPSELEDRCNKVIQGKKPSTAIQCIPTYCGYGHDYTDIFSSESDVEAAEDPVRYPAPRGTASTFSELVLQMQLHSEDVRSLWSPASQLALNADVPEFYPQMFCQTSDANSDHAQGHSDGDSMVEYDNMLVPSLDEWLQYSYPLFSTDYNNLETLATSLENLEQQRQVFLLPPPVRSSSPTRPLPHHNHPQPPPSLPAPAPPPVVPATTPPPCKEPVRRLYSAVLQNQRSTVVSTCVGEASGTPGASVSAAVARDADEADDELDALEREALEQYRPSVESLTRSSDDSIVSAKFQELERLALEQYSGGSGGVNAADASPPALPSPAPAGNAPRPLHEPPCGGKAAAALLLTNSMLLGLYRSVAGTRLLSYLGGTRSASRFR